MRALKLGIVCPMANEIDTAIKFVDDVLTICRADLHFSSVTFFVILDSVTNDGTLTALKQHQAITSDLRVVWAAESRCITDAYVRGYREAVDDGCDWILEIDAGYSHQPTEIPRFFAKMDEGYDCVFGSRFCEGGDMSNNTFRRKLLSRGGTLLSNFLFGTRLKDMTSGFQLFSRPALESILERGIRSRGPFFQTEMKAYSHRLNVAEVPITYSGASHSIGSTAIIDSLAGFWRLYQLRLQGRL